MKNWLLVLHKILFISGFYSVIVWFNIYLTHAMHSFLLKNKALWFIFLKLGLKFMQLVNFQDISHFGCQHFATCVAKD